MLLFLTTISTELICNELRYDIFFAFFPYFLKIRSIPSTLNAIISALGFFSNALHTISSYPSTYSMSSSVITRYSPVAFSKAVFLLLLNPISSESTHKILFKPRVISVLPFRPHWLIIIASDDEFSLSNHEISQRS